MFLTFFQRKGDLEDQLRRATYAFHTSHPIHRHNHQIDRKPIGSVCIACCYIESNSVHKSFSDIPSRPIYQYNRGRHRNAIAEVNNDQWICNETPISGYMLMQGTRIRQTHPHSHPLYRIRICVGYIVRNTYT